MNRNILSSCKQFGLLDVFWKFCELKTNCTESSNHRRGKLHNILSVGGSDEDVVSIEQYNAKEDSWKMIHNISINLKYFGAECVGNQLYLIGGVENDSITNKVNNYFHFNL